MLISTLAVLRAISATRKVIQLSNGTFVKYQISLSCAVETFDGLMFAKLKKMIYMHHLNSIVFCCSIDPMYHLSINEPRDKDRFDTF